MCRTRVTLLAKSAWERRADGSRDAARSPEGRASRRHLLEVELASSVTRVDSVGQFGSPGNAVSLGVFGDRSKAEQVAETVRKAGFTPETSDRLRTMDVFYAFPSILLAVAISGTMGGGMRNGMLALTLVFIPPLCRVAETATTQVSHLDFVEAARASGAGLCSIIWHHILGNVLGPIFIYASSLVSVSILIASGLSFLGLGVEPPTPDWGLMLNTLRQVIYIAPSLAALPGVLIFMTSICFNLLSDGLRAAMDVRM